MKLILKNNKTKRSSESGFTGADVLIAIAIITLFTGLVTSISYNIYLATMSTQRMSQANAYISDVFAQSDKLYYDDVTTNGLTTYFNDKYKNTAYTVTITVDQYKPNGDASLDLVKIITMNVKYKVGSKDQKLEMTKVKQREVLITPNAPDLSMLQNAIPIKYSNGAWTVCDAKDSNWYNYNNGYWATAFVPNSGSTITADIGKTLSAADLIGGSLYVWIPRYGISGGTINFLYGTGDNYVIGGTSGATSLTPIAGYTGPFSGTTDTGVWRLSSAAADPYYQGLNSGGYKIQNK